ncbi:MAG: hypothetical protein GXN92_01215 [Candidatus Micrarchaeota archaeon]|nr:hypothetical protein [Candidatus Micrarchaeota archaeon]
MKGQLFSLDIIAAGLAFIILILGVYLFLVGFEGGVDQFTIYATRLNELIFSEEPFYGIYKEGKVIYADPTTVRMKLTAAAQERYVEGNYISNFVITFDPPLKNDNDTLAEFMLSSNESCDNAIKKITFHRYAVDEEGVGHKITLTVCLVPKE